MIAVVLVACVAIPLLLLVVDVFSPTKREHRGVGVHDEIRPHVSAVVDRRDVHRADAVPEAPAAPRAPRIAPGDGMVYRPAQRATRPR